MPDESTIVGSAVEQVEVVAVVSVLGLRPGDRATLPLDYPELVDCVDHGFLHVIVDGVEVIPDPDSAAPKRRCGSCGGG